MVTNLDFCVSVIIYQRFYEILFCVLMMLVYKVVVVVNKGLSEENSQTQVKREHTKYMYDFSLVFWLQIKTYLEVVKIIAKQ